MIQQMIIQQKNRKMTPSKIQYISQDFKQYYRSGSAMSPDGSGLYLPAQAEELPQSEELRIEFTCVVLVPFPQIILCSHRYIHSCVLVNPSNMI